jgi:hypothetical protein
VPEVNCSQLKSPAFVPAAPPLGVFPGVSGIVNCWPGVSPVVKSLPGRFWKNASTLPLCSWSCCKRALLLLLLLLLWLLILVDDAGLASNEFLPDRLLLAAKPLLLLLCRSDADVLEFGVGLSDASPPSGDADMSPELASFPKPRSIPDPKVGAFPDRIRSIYPMGTVFGHRPFTPDMFDGLVWLLERFGSASTMSGPPTGSPRESLGFMK